LSIDDIYLKRSEREKLAREIHSLLITRGVPGTHDVRLGEQILDKLCNARPKDTTRIPRFNKAIDDQYPESEWDKFTGRPDVILFDGWFMGAVEQPEPELKKPVNELEKDEDPDAVWRSYVNEQLKTVYKPLFEQLDLLVMLKVPSFDKIYEWRALQEDKLRIRNQGQKKLRIMNADELKRFIAHYERLTRHILNEMPDRADMLFRVNDDHRICI
jgi:D-glycerate 3-kinase